MSAEPSNRPEAPRPPAPAADQEGRAALQDLGMVVLSLFAVMALLLEILVELDDEVSRLLEILDHGLCVVFFLDFLSRLARARDRGLYMRTWGWLDLLSSVPMIEPLRALRLARLIRIFRAIRAFASIRRLLASAFRDRARGTAQSAALIALLTVILCSLMILWVEREADSPIRTAEDALWWAWVTVTTVGYGDLYPVTTEGRVLAAVLMAVGVGMFGAFTAWVASWFLGSGDAQPAAPPAPDHAAVMEELRALRAEVARLEAAVRSSSPPPES